MTKTIAIALVASLGFAGAASASNAMLETLAQNAFDTLKIDVDAGTLTDTQLAQVHSVVVDEGIDDDDFSRIRSNNYELIRRLDAIVN